MNGNNNALCAVLYCYNNILFKYNMVRLDALVGKLMQMQQPDMEWQAKRRSDDDDNMYKCPRYASYRKYATAFICSNFKEREKERKPLPTHLRR